MDPNRDVESYIRAATERGLRITHVTETHIHADFVSGARELARRTGARLLLSAEGGPDWQYRFPAEPLRDGDRITVGSVTLGVLHTPGHTPEHLSFVVTSDDEPTAILTGDFVFVGDVGRPDLLERAAGQTGTMESAARTLFRSLQRFKQLPADWRIWPGHGAGSACGKALGSAPSSTVGQECLTNWALTTDSEDAFVHEVLSGQPDAPAYFARMKRVNRDGLPSATTIDLRPAGAFAEGHVAGTINIPFDASFLIWAGSLVPAEIPIYLIGDTATAAKAQRALSLIGLDDVRGIRDVSEARGHAELIATPQTTVAQLQARRAAHEPMTILDVRARHEWDAGHIPDAVHIPLGQLPQRAAELPRDRPILVHCQGGARSAIAASVLQSLGATHVENVVGGFAEWRRAGS